MASPMVFQTTPPQPASNARCACFAVFDGGPDATQNGFGDLMPAKLTDKSAMRGSVVRAREHRVDAPRRAFAVGHRMHHLVPAVRAIAARKHTRQVRPARRRIALDCAATVKS